MQSARTHIRRRQGDVARQLLVDGEVPRQQIWLADVMLGQTEGGGGEKSLKRISRSRKDERRLKGSRVSGDESGRKRRGGNGLQGTIRGITHNISERGRADCRYIVIKPVGATNGCLPFSCQVIGEPEARAE